MVNDDSQKDICRLWMSNLKPVFVNEPYPFSFPDSARSSCPALIIKEKENSIVFHPLKYGVHSFS
jgi:hypothetical protein